MIDDATEVRDLEAQMDLAMEGVRKAVLRLLQDGEVHPQLVVLAVARVVGELGAGIAQAGGMDLETILADVTEVARQAGRSHHEPLRAEALPVAGSARTRCSASMKGSSPSVLGSAPYRNWSLSPCGEASVSSVS